MLLVQRLLIHAINVPFSLLNSKRRLRSCSNRDQTVQPAWGLSMWWPTYKPPKTPKPQSSTNFDLKMFLVSILLKQRKRQHPRRTSNNNWRMTRLWLKLRVFWLHEIWALKRQKKLKPYFGGSQTNLKTAT